MNKKEQILFSLKMEDILKKYGIKTKRTMFCCPFHNDKTPSAKFFDTSFHCFGCGKNGDLIQFVQDYFHLDFKEAMEKINQDFNLGLERDYKVDYNKIQKIRNERLQKQIREKNLNKEFVQYCKKRWEYENKQDRISKEINCKNWEEKTKEQLTYRDLIAGIDEKLDIINNKILDLKQ